MPFGYQTFYHLNSKLIFCYSRHGLNNEPFDEQTVLDHLNTELVSNSDPTVVIRLLLTAMLANQTLASFGSLRFLMHSVTGHIRYSNGEYGDLRSYVLESYSMQFEFVHQVLVSQKDPPLCVQ